MKRNDVRDHLHIEQEVRSDHKWSWETVRTHLWSDLSGTDVKTRCEHTWPFPHTWTWLLWSSRLSGPTRSHQQEHVGNIQVRGGACRARGGACRAAGGGTWRINSAVDRSVLLFTARPHGVGPHHQKIWNLLVFPRWRLRLLRVRLLFFILRSLCSSSFMETFPSKGLSHTPPPPPNSSGVSRVHAGLTTARQWSYFFWSKNCFHVWSQHVQNHVASSNPTLTVWLTGALTCTDELGPNMEEEFSPGCLLGAVLPHMAAFSLILTQISSVVSLKRKCTFTERLKLICWIKTNDSADRLLLRLERKENEWKSPNKTELSIWDKVSGAAAGSIESTAAEPSTMDSSISCHDDTCPSLKENSDF